MDGVVVLTLERMELALQRCDSRQRHGEQDGTGRTCGPRGDWTVLSASPGLRPHLQALWSDKCPSWITESLQRNIKKPYSKEEEEEEEEGENMAEARSKRR